MRTPRGLETLEQTIEHELWERLRTWNVLVDIDDVIVERVLRKMADKARHWREAE